MKLSVIVLTHNSGARLAECFQSLKTIDEIIIVDDNSTDNTLAIAKSFAAKILVKKLKGFASQRNFGLTAAHSPWVLFIDSDEVVPSALLQQIKLAITRSEFSAYRMKRLNYFYGRAMKHGGYWPDWQTRLFRVDAFIGYSGAIHESPKFKGALGSLSENLLHYSHQNLSAGLIKSAYWTKLEAKEFIKAGHPPITWWRIVKVMVWEFCYRYFKKLGFLDGYIGFIESLIQALNRFFVYQQIWELQQS
ncbi:MAG: glycosyltransferase family 2 protein [Patescibacteria group bacterium]